MQLQTNIDLKRKDTVIPKGKVLIQLQNVKTGKIRQYLVNNLVTDAGKAAMAAGLSGETANNKGIITYCALGTDGTAPDPADTTLGAELFRKQVSVRSVDGNIATFQTFFTTAEAIGTLLEAGLFGDDASGTTDSGTLFCKVAINRVKTANDTLTLSWSVTIGG